MPRPAWLLLPALPLAAAFVAAALPTGADLAFLMGVSSSEGTVDEVIELVIFVEENELHLYNKVVIIVL